ncbi:MAG: site-specific integrase [Opitutaceae bacterium]|jgi:integrase|nr:site-specific integrase [Opitutaceae bacterium]
MKTKSAFIIKPFKNRNGVISFRVAGWLLGERIRKNFKTREAAILERGTLQLRQAQADSDLRVTSTFLTEPQLREAEAVFLKLKSKPRTLTFYLDVGLETHREPKSGQPLADAIVSYLAERAKEVTRKAICQRQHDAIRTELTLFEEYFPNRTLGELTTGRLLEYLRRDSAAAKTQNNRRATLSTFFKYACAPAQGWLLENPVKAVARQRTGHNRGSAPALSTARVAQLMTHVEAVHDGALVPYFALCLFAGIRPDGEISKLPAADVRLETAAITIEPWVSKVNMCRMVTIQPNLAAWLRAYPLNEYTVIPPKEKMRNVAGKITRIRQKFGVGHDVLRHTFISMHVAKFRSMGDTALQAGNSEEIIRKHYLNVTTPREAEAFFDIVPLRHAVPENAPQAEATTSQANTARGGAARKPAVCVVEASAPAEARQLAA